MTGDQINIGGVSGSVFAAGRGSRAQGTVSNGPPPDLEVVRAELIRLVEELRGAGRPEALRHAENLQEAVADEAPQAVERSWTKLRAALGSLAVSANLAQIGQFVQAFVA
ncbi:hypothetical protein [Actinomycetospora termitidis]|uniref:Uncharacterized protein n=1 Tax=Actinomycetospora termitidis TaxID=3053470 RepID=A0ABT7MED9_9PSEU|nr:hypothetical protein [Actinomycetospora sp. Odt1-22]MDL5159024.1 hypothetical protein [Actinomycetospora sp. Odt1-22]